MAGCDNIHGVKNILLTLTNCETGQVYGPYSHELSSEDLPTWKPCTWTNEALPGGYVRRTAANASANISVIRDRRVPLALYQGCGSVDIQVEYENGNVFTGKGGSVVGDEQSDAHSVALDLVFRVLNELLPPDTTSLAA